MEKWVRKKKFFFRVNAQLSSIEVFSYHEIKFCVYICIYIYISGLDVSPSAPLNIQRNHFAISLDL